MSLLIQNGRAVTSTDTFVADILIEDQKVSLIGQDLETDAALVIDATGKYVLPGCIDPHTHIDSLFLGARSSDNFDSGTLAAAFGGTTTIVEFCEPSPGQHLLNGLSDKRKKLGSARLVVDVGLHMIVRAMEDDTPDVLRRLVDEGITSFKLFMAFKDIMLEDSSLFRVMQMASNSGALVMVHAENGDVIDVLVEQALASGKREPRYHALTRPVETEAEATNRAIQLARLASCPLYLVHVSCAEAVELIASARANGQPVWGETCPQYLLFDEAVLELPDFEGAKYVYTPPPRPRKHQETIWEGLRTDALSVVATDHSPFLFDGGKTLGREDFSKIPPGVGGLEERLMLLHHFGVRQGRLSLQRMVELLATNPAKLFGIYPRKGTIAVGSDADIVVFDPFQKRTLSVKTQQSRSDYTIYEGMQVVGSPETVLVRGHPVILRNELVDSHEGGIFLRRGLFKDTA